MAHKQVRRITSSRGSGKGSSGAKNKSRTSTIPRSSRQSKKTVFTRRGEELQSRNPAKSDLRDYLRTNWRNLPDRSRSSRTRAFNVLADLRRAEEQGRKLTFSQAVKDHDTTSRNVKRWLGSEFRQERPGGKIAFSQSDSRKYTLYIPNTKGERRVPVRTGSSKDREITGQWLTAAAFHSRGEPERMEAFIKKHGHAPIVAGVRLPTGDYELGKISKNIDNWREVFEQFYKGTRR
jgi:hypothetical protein